MMFASSQTLSVDPATFRESVTVEVEKVVIIIVDILQQCVIKSSDVGGCGRLTFIGKEYGSLALCFYTRERGPDRALANEEVESAIMHRRRRRFRSWSWSARGIPLDQLQ
jgi:hypothetical protein